MAEKHDRLLAHYRARLANRRYRIESKSPFPDYRPDIWATKGRRKIFVEVEIETTLYGNHTLEQLIHMHSYLIADHRASGVLVVPRLIKGEAAFLLDSVFGDRRIRAEGL